MRCVVLSTENGYRFAAQASKLNRLQTMLPSSSGRGFGKVHGKALHTTGPWRCVLIGGKANDIITKTVPLLVSSFLS